MNRKKLTREIACQKLQDFFLDTPMVLFGTGASCALDGAFGMEALKTHLVGEIKKQSLSVNQKTEWNDALDSLRVDNDFERAMNSVQDQDLLGLITNLTAEFVACLDGKYALRLLRGEDEWPAIGLFKRLVDGLTGANRKLHVATPNYDLLAEYAFERANLPYITGFTGGVCRCLDWKQAERAVTRVENVTRGSKVRKVTRLKKHIRLYKVHGSLNTFTLNNRIVENNAWICAPPDGVERLVITPGTSKFERLHKNRGDLLGPYDDAVETHNAFLFIGFGFNDSQLCNDALRAKLIEQKCSGLILTRGGNERIESLLKECDNLWLVRKIEDDGNDGACIYNRQYKSSLRLDGKPIWKTDEFTKEILGG